MKCHSRKAISKTFRTKDHDIIPNFQCLAMGHIIKDGPGAELEFYIDDRLFTLRVNPEEASKIIKHLTDFLNSKYVKAGA